MKLVSDLSLTSFRRAVSGPFGMDADAAAHIAAVEAADGAALEPAVTAAYDAFVRGCKQDGLWDALKASCIMAGARTLAGALTPLKGPVPMNIHFIPADYDRVTGLEGDGETKLLRSGRNTAADPQDNHHMAVYATAAITGSGNRGYIGAGLNQPGATHLFRSGSGSNPMGFRSRNAGHDWLGQRDATGLIGMSRHSAAGYDWITGDISGTRTRESEAPLDREVLVFGRDLDAQCDGRLAFYSIGEALDLAALGTRVCALMSALQEALA